MQSELQQLQVSFYQQKVSHTHMHHYKASLSNSLLTFMYVIVVVICTFILYSYTSSLTYSFFIHAVHYHCCTYI